MGSQRDGHDWATELNGMADKWKSLSHVQLFAAPWTVAHQTPLYVGILQERILEWAAMLSSRGSSWRRNQNQVFCIAGGFFTIWAPREASEFLVLWEDKTFIYI